MARAAAPTAPRFEHRTDDGRALEVATATPRLSWAIPSAEAGFIQEEYEVEVTPEAGQSATFAAPGMAGCARSAFQASPGGSWGTPERIHAGREYGIHRQEVHPGWRPHGTGRSLEIRVPVSYYDRLDSIG